uniref:UBA domain-containing protein n=1 Tax=Alexandrium catenella TaxID=2925 RepID=A0A7S1M0S7_ALECA|mmetsp:Transcript_17669/g.48024  ORF Transcript_17669/g.48024 Transcript_17669/m.48024 type:complete len:642 (+) Transcript_17669:139-2064(+)
MEVFEDQMNSIRTEWHAVKEKWFHGETMDPVFEGVVRDFCVFDETMQNVHQKVGIFMRGVEQLAHGMTALSEGVSTGLTHANDSQIASDSCKMKEATNQIARADAPHSAIAKLRRDMHFNILNPVQNHIANNRNLKVSLDIRRRRLIELNSAKKTFDDCVKKNLSHTDRRYLQAQSVFESARMTFNDVDRHVFEWLYILEEYRGDILDSTLQTLKYLEYEFFATSAHAISSSLPTRMEFRPMVEMTPEHLEAQVEMELKESEEGGSAVAATGAPETAYADFSARLIDKKVKEEPTDEGPAVPVDPLSLSSLLSQGFEEGPARRALRMHRNDTQAAMDWLIDGQHEEVQKVKQVSEGVRMPTTIKRVQKLKAMRKAQQEKQKEKQQQAEQKDDTRGGASEEKPESAASSGAAAASSSNGAKGPSSSDKGTTPAAPPAVMEDLVDMDAGPSKPKSAAVTDLLGFGEDVPAVPTDFSRPVEMTELPAQVMFDASRCEKQPLPAAVAAGIVQPRTGTGVTPPATPQGPGLGEVFGLAPSSGMPGDMLSAMQATGTAQPSMSGGRGYPATVPAAGSAGFPMGLQPSAAQAAPFMAGAGPQAARSGFEALDPLAAASGQPPPKPAASDASRDSFGDLMALAAGRGSS